LLIAEQRAVGFISAWSLAFLQPTYILLELRIILISLIIYKPSILIISPWTFSTQLGAGITLFCLSQCATPICTLSTGGVLSTKCEDSKWRLVAFISKSLNTTEQNYKIHDKEMLAVIRCLEA